MVAAPETNNHKQVQRPVPELIEHIQILINQIQALYCLDAIPWVVGYSGGKDSTAVLQLVWSAISALPPEKRTKTIYVITTDTLVENPIVATWVTRSLERMKVAAQEQNLPFEPHLLKPKVKDSYWVNLIGKGYPAPRPGFRWCTERLKIWPTNVFIRDKVRIKGEILIILGTRKAESTRRAKAMSLLEKEQLETRLGSKATQISTTLYAGLPNTSIYSPIEDWTNSEVWIYLNQFPNPWGYSNKDLFQMYRGATEDNECPLVIDTSTPSCGDSRFGCWVCTLVNKDKSMAAMIQNDDEKEWMQPLLDLRNELDVRDDYDRRDFRRMSGNIQLVSSKVEGSDKLVPISGPYTKKWREHWLRQVLIAQVQARQNAPEDMKTVTLITPDELSEIRRIWREEKHEFDDSLPRIYREVTKEIFRDPRPGADSSLLGSDEWSLLEEICDDPMQLELMAKLLDTERQYKTSSRRTGIYDALKKCFEASSRSGQDALNNAYRNRDLRTAALEGDTDKIKHLQDEDAKDSFTPAWADLKFGRKLRNGMKPKSDTDS